MVDVGNSECEPNAHGDGRRMRGRHFRRKHPQHGDGLGVQRPERAADGIDQAVARVGVGIRVADVFAAGVFCERDEFFVGGGAGL